MNFAERMWNEPDTFWDTYCREDICVARQQASLLIFRFIWSVRFVSDSGEYLDWQTVTFDLQVTVEDLEVHCFVVLLQCECQLVVVCVSLEHHTDLFLFSFLICPPLIHPPHFCLHMPFSTVSPLTCSTTSLSTPYILPFYVFLSISLSCHVYSPCLFPFHPLQSHRVGVPVNSRVSSKIQQLLNTLKRPKRPPLREFFVDDFEELLDGKPAWK